VYEIPYDPLELQNMAEASVSYEDDWIATLDLHAQLEKVRERYVDPKKHKDRARWWELAIRRLALEEGTFREVGAAMGRSHSRAQQVEGQILRMLRYDEGFRQAYNKYEGFVIVGEEEVVSLLQGDWRPRWTEPQHAHAFLGYFKERCCRLTAAGDFLTHRSVLTALRRASWSAVWFPVARYNSVVGCLRNASYEWDACELHL
jgi:hypothetical protein